jgi:hypothetical protein
MKAELAEARAQKATLEEQIKKLHFVRMELDVMFDNEKTILLKQQERDKETVRFIVKGQFPSYLYYKPFCNKM